MRGRSCQSGPGATRTAEHLLRQVDSLGTPSYITAPSLNKGTPGECRGRKAMSPPRRARPQAPITAGPPKGSRYDCPVECDDFDPRSLSMHRLIPGTFSFVLVLVACSSDSSTPTPFE